MATYSFLETYSACKQSSYVSGYLEGAARNKNASKNIERLNFQILFHRKKTLPAPCQTLDLW
jgi:hypothetical protein